MENYCIHLNLLNTLEMASLFVYLFSDAQRHACGKLIYFGVVVKIKNLIIATCVVAVPMSSCARKRRAARLLTVTVDIVLLTAIGAVDSFTYLATAGAGDAHVSRSRH